VLALTCSARMVRSRQPAVAKMGIIQQSPDREISWPCWKHLIHSQHYLPRRCQFPNRLRPVKRIRAIVLPAIGPVPETPIIVVFTIAGQGLVLILKHLSPVRPDFLVRRCKCTVRKFRRWSEMINQTQRQLNAIKIQKILWQMVRSGHFRPIQRILKRYFNGGHLDKRYFVKLGLTLDFERKTHKNVNIDQKIFLAHMSALLSPRLTRRPAFLGKSRAESRKALQDPAKKAKLLRLLKRAKRYELGVAFALDVPKAYKPCSRCKGSGVRFS
jgi:hypothetical protein